ncbi:MAG: hypothetical protein QOG89_2616 [Thermomicrobiales bacterium]|nr:hypothetical protein [Thermomicrobiales bacterium]
MITALTGTTMSMNMTTNMGRIADTTMLTTGCGGS